MDEIVISRDVALVLFEMLTRSEGAVQALAPGEQAALWDLEATLESSLAEPFAPDYRERLDAARARLEASSPTPALGKPSPVCFVDVDDTLVRSFGSKRIPMTVQVERVRELHARGVELYCWSTGGAAYALRSAEELGIEQCFAGYLPKPQVMIDDQAPGEWRSLTCLHPNEVSSMSAHEIVEKAQTSLG